MVRYLESFDASTPIPNYLEFHPPADSHQTLVLSWIATSSLIPTKPIPRVPGDDETSLKELPLWLLYFATVLVRSCSEFAFILPPPTSGAGAVQRRPLMIEAPTSHEAGEEELSFRWFQSHSRPASSSRFDGGARADLAELKDKDKLNPPPPILELKPAIQSQAPDVVHPPTLPTANSLHLVDYIDKSWSEITDPNQREDASPTLHSETSSVKTELSHPHLCRDVSEPILVRSFERISGRRTTPRIQSEYGQVSCASETRPPFPSLEVISTESLPREYDLCLLSEFPAPPKTGESLSCVVFVTLQGFIVNLLPP